MQGTPFGRYRLVELLGRGGMGEVWRAYDSDTSRVVAIKVLPASLADDATFEARFRREALAAAGLNNPHVIPIHHFGEIDGRLYVDMRFVDGHDLQAEIPNGPIDPERAVAIVEQVASALDAAHSIGLIHRDVKPSNILLDKDDFAYLIDFGIARAAGESGLTSTGSTVGTWAYMAPERFTAGVADARSDVYSLACVLHECLTGSQPFPGDSFEQLAAGHMFQAPPRPSLSAEVPVGFDEVIATGMAKAPQQRYRTTKDLAVAARRALSSSAPATQLAVPSFGGPIGHQSPATLVSPDDPTQHRDVPTLVPTAKPTRRTRILIAAAVAAIVVIVAAILITQNPTTTTTSATPKPTTSTATNKPIYGTQVDLPIRTLQMPFGVAVAGDGTVYIADTYNNRIVMLAVGSSREVVLPFTGLFHPLGVAVDTSGNVYITDSLHQRVLNLVRGSTKPIELPFNGLHNPYGLAVDTAGNIYVADNVINQVLKVAPGATQQTEVALVNPGFPFGVAVDSVGNLYVVGTRDNRVYKLAAGATQQTDMPFTGLRTPSGVAVDATGNVFVVDSANHRVVALAPGATKQTVLPITGLEHPVGVAVDISGNVYVADTGNSRIVKLPRN
jgi:serine/threonine protein kinase, bacterial